MVVVFQRITSTHEGVSGSTLWLLNYEVDTGVGNFFANEVGLMPDDGVDVCYRDYLSGGGDHVREQRSSPDLVQYLRMFRLEASAFASRHNGDCEAGILLVRRTGIAHFCGGHRNEYTAPPRKPSRALVRSGIAGGTPSRRPALG